MSVSVLLGFGASHGIAKHVVQAVHDLGQALLQRKSPGRGRRSENAARDLARTILPGGALRHESAHDRALSGDTRGRDLDPDARGGGLARQSGFPLLSLAIMSLRLMAVVGMSTGKQESGSTTQRRDCICM